MTSVAEALKKGWQLHQSENLAAAENVYRQVVQVAPEDPAAWCYLGMVLFDQQRFLESVEAYRESTRLKPDFPVALNNMGNALKALRRYSEAKNSLEAALRLQPNYANAHANLGGVLLAMQRPDAAVASCRRALQIAPDNLEARNSLAAALVRQGDAEQAIACCREVLQRIPTHVGAQNNLAAALARDCKFGEAADVFQNLIALQPDNAEAWKGLAVCQSRMGNSEVALQSFRRSLKLDPHAAETHRDFGISLLRGGHFTEGWQEYEWRWRCENRLMPDYRQPLWSGDSLTGRTIFVYNEQGLGDTLQFIRYAQVLNEHGARVVAQCQKPLSRLLERCSYIDELIPEGARPPAFDIHAPLLSLPRIMETNWDSIPANVPYLFANADLASEWRERLATVRQLKIGISWQGNPKNEIDYFRSAPLKYFAPLMAMERVQVFSLQKGEGLNQLAEFDETHAIENLGDKLDEDHGAFMDTAAVMMNLDLVITTDTAVAHLAGGLGVRTWVALSHSADWRWFTQRKDCPWYPTMRLFRQPAIGHWESVFQDMVLELDRL